MYKDVKKYTKTAKKLAVIGYDAVYIKEELINTGCDESLAEQLSSFAEDSKLRKKEQSKFSLTAGFILLLFFGGFATFAALEGGGRIPILLFVAIALGIVFLYHGLRIRYSSQEYVSISKWQIFLVTIIVIIGFLLLSNFLHHENNSDISTYNKITKSLYSEETNNAFDSMDRFDETLWHVIENPNPKSFEELFIIKDNYLELYNPSMDKINTIKNVMDPTFHDETFGNLTDQEIQIVKSVLREFNLSMSALDKFQISQNDDD
ncbi:DUF1097 domain-containing protein (plasmid) [Pontibacillus sp. ALD_SL1]|uniref:DUF1097 domain-containing protein n=1 Tax=Pontibacillus sp. ALD_SL1 TaxID=2777185 RepID=UPI001A95CF85|nr:DUF1097 domain-containing protein [Pontibacillus sp. ALD_SL1]QST02180.1 DUF1097 domain-containing protein [Pontibacillus sp. ALD_SL1]